MVEIKEIRNSSTNNPETDNSNEGSIVQQLNGDASVNEERTSQENQPPPSRLESFFAITKSLILRALIIYFITSFFRRPAPTSTEQGGVLAPTKLPSFNYFENGTVLVNEDEF